MAVLYAVTRAFKHDGVAVVEEAVEQSDVDGVDGGVVVRSQRRLSVRSILDYEHVGLQRLLAKGKEGKLVST